MISGHIEDGYTESIKNSTKNPFSLDTLTKDMSFLRWHLKAGNLPTPENLETCLKDCITSGLVDILALILSAVSLKKEYTNVIHRLISRMCVFRDDEITKLIFKYGFVPTDNRLVGFAYHNANWCIFEHLLVAGVRTDSNRFYRLKNIKNQYGEHHDREALRRMIYVFTDICDVILDIVFDYL